MGSGLALVAAIACGILIGSLNGFFVAFLGLPSLLVTLGTLFLFQGIGYAVTSGFSFAATDSLREEFVYNVVGGGNLAGINTSVVWVLIVLIVGPKLFIEPGTKAFFRLSSVSDPGL